MTFLKNKNILVVDDEEGIRELVTEELEFNGAKCLSAACGKDAVEVYKQNRIDAVVSDIRMPNGDGLYFLDRLKELNLELCPMVFMTGFSDIPLEEFYDRGVEAIIAKPFRLEQIVNALDSAINSPRMAFRRAPRVVAVLNIEVSWASISAPMKTKTFNVGRGGLFVQSAKEFPNVGFRVKFTISYTSEGRDEILSGDLVVRWLRKQSTMGIPSGFGGEFVGLTPEQMDEIASVAGLARTNVYIPKK